jgi:prophage maintenance system killer protein
MEKEDIIKLNKELGGSLSRPSSLDFACDYENKNIYKKNAWLIRAIAVDHPFTDFNKSTATITTIRNFKEQGIKCNEEKLTRGILNIARKNQTNLNKIEKMLRKCCPKKN